MVGANKQYLLGSKSGASYGNEMWTFIKNSINNPKNGLAQKKRMVSYSTTLYFNVSEDKTLKMMYTGDDGVYTPRHWAPTWPQKDDLIPDLGYQSIRPCRPDGNARECCVFDVESDAREDRPINADCSSLKDEGISIYGFDICDDGFPTICLNSSQVDTDIDFYDFSIWSHYGASGPFVNKDAQPVGSNLDMLCICDGFSLFQPNGTEQTKIQSFTPAVLAPYVCNDFASPGDVDVAGNAVVAPVVDCTGGFARVPQVGQFHPNCIKVLSCSCAHYHSVISDEWRFLYSVNFISKGGMLQAYVAQGISEELAEQFLKIPAGLILPEVMQAFKEYITREGYVEWPKFSKFPYVGFGLDSCPLKQATTVPVPVESLSPWLGASPDGNPTAPKATVDLCVPYTPKKSWCPSRTNPLQEYVKSWSYDRSMPFGLFEDDTSFFPIEENDTMNLTEACKMDCSKDPIGTAYIGDSESDQWGIKV